MIFNETTYDTFQKSYLDFVDQTKSRNRYRGFSSWFDRVNSCHQKVREFLGGTRVTKKISHIKNIDTTVFNCVKEDIENLIEKYQYSFDGYLAEYKFSPKDLIYAIIPSGRIKWGKHYFRWASKKGINSTTIDYILDQLSRISNKSKSMFKTPESASSTVILTTSATSFARLGHYGPIDEGSCFRQSSSNYRDKYILGQTPNSFVLLISTKNTGITDEMNLNDNFDCRCWGFFNEKMNTVFINNWYHAREASKDEFIPIVNAFFSLLFDKDICVHGTKLFFKTNYAYYNPNSQVSFSTQEKIKKINSVYNIADRNIRTIWSERTKNLPFLETEGIKIDDQIVHSTEVKYAKTCEHSGKLTFKDRVKVIGKNGKYLLISPSFCGTVYQQCAILGQYCLSVENFRDNLHISKKVLRKNPKAYRKCDATKRYFPVEELIETTFLSRNGSVSRICKEARRRIHGSILLKILFVLNKKTGKKTQFTINKKVFYEASQDSFFREKVSKFNISFDEENVTLTCPNGETNG